jgi:hypothetical protein
MFWGCSTRSHLKMWCDLGCEMWARAKGTGTILRNLCCWFSPSLCLLPSSHSMCVLFAKKSHWILVECDATILVCRMQLFSRPQEQQLYHHVGRREVGKHCVCVHPQWQYTHYELMLYIALLPKAHKIEQTWHLGDTCKLSCTLFLILCLCAPFLSYIVSFNRYVCFVCWKNLT